MNLIEIDSLDYPGVEIFASLTEAQLRNVLEPDKGIFIAESPKVIAVALEQGYEHGTTVERVARRPCKHHRVDAQRRRRAKYGPYVSGVYHGLYGAHTDGARR